MSNPDISWNPSDGSTVGQLAELVAACERAEGIELPIDVDDAGPTDARTLLTATEAGRLIAAASLPDDPEPEAIVLVHPDHRRRGIGRQIVQELLAEVQRRGLTELTLICDERSPSGPPFLVAIGAERASAEYRLAATAADLDRSRPRIDGLTLRKATEDDQEALVDVLAASFGQDRSESEERVDAGLAETRRAFYLGLLDGQPVAALKAGGWERDAGITAFGVLPSHQGRGIGRQLLLDAADLLAAEGWPRILIEVDIDNAPAVALYRNTGFHVVTTYGYYTLGTGYEVRSTK